MPLSLSVIPLDVGTLYTDKSLVTPRRDYGVEFGAANLIWYIEGASAKILVDTSFRSAEEVSRIHAPQKVVRTPEQEIVPALARIGVRPQEIEIVILTHLHWDHCQNNRLFTNAMFFVQRSEMQYAIAPLPMHGRVYEALTLGMRPQWLDTPRFQVITGDREIVKGVRVIHTPGHTPGFQCVVVSTDKGRVTIAGCTVGTYENWGSSAKGTHLPAGLYVNLEDYYHSLERIEKESDIVLPGHDASVLRQSKYP